jgi:hypothetical protein
VRRLDRFWRGLRSRSGFYLRFTQGAVAGLVGGRESAGNGEKGVRDFHVGFLSAMQRWHIVRLFP